MYILRDLGWALGVQAKFTEAEGCFCESLSMAERLGRRATTESDTTMDQGVALGFWGAILAGHSHFREAEDRLLESRKIKESLHAASGTFESLNWLGLASELQGEWEKASAYYRERTQEKPLGINYFECGALTGLVRVKHAQRDFAAVPTLLAEAEQLAQQYEYNDHLASLRVMQGHVAWDGRLPEWGTGFEAAFRHYQHALIYALRYNRFLLDEALSGRPQGTPLRPIIPHCLERGEEGRRMLVALRDWWQTGVNDVGTPRPDTISPIREAIPLLEAERIAREREPGDGSPQRMVLEQIKAALSR
jgi:tetratricopeptide (TPR) repeat protein